MNERIKKLRRKLELSQEEFGERLEITRSSISRIESGINNPSDQTIKLICSEFHVNENWLRTGQGGDENMFKKEFPNNEYMAYATLIGNGANDRIKEAIIKYGRLSPENKKIIDDAIELVMQMLKKEE